MTLSISKNGVEVFKIETAEDLNIKDIQAILELLGKRKK